MQYSLILPVLGLLAPAQAAETVLGAYIYHRHGDRTPKALPPASLTTLGYEQVYTSGGYYRSRYLDNSSASYIKGINQNVVKLSQIAVTAPVDNVLQNSAQGFVQGLYPAVGETTAQITLRDNDTVQAPLNGYQLIPINIATSGTGSEDSTWLQASTGCNNAVISSNNYFSSADYIQRLNNTKSFYSDLVPVVNGTFADSYVTFKNAYAIWDLINVAEIHNATINASDVLTNDTLFQTRTLADAHEWGLAYNASDNMRAVSGMQLAGEILQYLNSTITSGQAGSATNLLGIQFGAYATFMSFFGLADLQNASVNFTGVTDYASSMVLELFTNASVSNGYPSVDDIQVRFLYHNGTATNTSEPVAYPLFGGSADAVSWTDFQNGINKFAISTTQEWCTACGNTTGTCAAYAPSASGGAAQSSSGGHHGMSAAVGGVIGAFVTLGVILLVTAAAMLIGGLRLVPKSRLGAGSASPVSQTAQKA